MELAFRTRRLRAICEDAEVANRELGPSVAHALIRRLADLRAADSVDDLLVGSPTRQEKPHPTLSMDLGGGTLVCRVNHPNPPLTSDGTLDWARVRRLLVIDVVKEENANA